MNDSEKIRKALKQARRVLIPLHINTDGDSVGSALALYRLLKRWDKDAEVVSADPLPKNFLFLPGAKEIKEVDPAELDLSQYDLLAALDISTPSRSSRSKNFKFPSGLTLINIDHHQDNKEFGDLNYVIPKAASATEILFDLLERWKIKIDEELAQCLLTGILADTNSFQNANTRPESLEKSAGLIRLGADHSEIVTNIFRSWSRAAVNLWTVILKNLKTETGLAYSTLTRGEIQKSGIEQWEASPARSFALESLIRVVEGTDIAAIFSEEREGKIHCSLRSRLGFNIGKIAEQMGGGGHAQAAAFEIKGNLKGVVDKTIKLVKDTLK
jgi:phosphoesterase RecJ-like protein